jgi:hypothetical protein
VVAEVETTIEDEVATIEVDDTTTTVQGEDVVAATIQQLHQVEVVDETKELTISLRSCWIP